MAERLTSTSWWWEPAGRSVRGPDAARRGQDVVVLEARDRVGGRVLDHDARRRRDGRRGRRPVDRTRPAPDEQARAPSSGSRRSRPTTTARTSCGSATRRVATRGEIPPINPVALVDMAQSQLRFDRMARKVPLEAPWAAPRAERWDSKTFATWIVRNTRTAKARGSSAALLGGGVRGRAAGLLAAAHALLHALGRRGGRAGRGAQRRAAGPLRRRFAAHRRCAWPRRSARTSCASARRCAAIEQRDDVVTVLADGAAASPPGARSSRSRPRSPAASPTTRRCPACRDQLTQKMPGRLGDQVQRRLRRAVLARRRADRSGHRRRGPDQGHVRQLAAVGHARACCSRSSKARTRACSAGSRPTTGGPRCSASLVELLRAARPSDVVEYVELDWSEEEWTRGCYGAHFPRGVWTQFGPALREPVRPHPLGRRRDRDGVERLHGRRAAVRRTRRDRGPRRHLAARGRRFPVTLRSSGVFLDGGVRPGRAVRTRRGRPATPGRVAQQGVNSPGRNVVPPHVPGRVQTARLWARMGRWLPRCVAPVTL